MDALEQFTVNRTSDDFKSFVVEIKDDKGTVAQLSATFEVLDEIANAINEQMYAMVEAAEKLAAAAQA